MVRKLLFTTLFTVLTAPAVGFAVQPTDVLGRYWNPDRDGQIEVFQRNGQIFGRIVWRKENVLDDKNPDPEARKRRVVGLVFMKGFVFDGDDSWDDGEVYSFRNGETYSGRLRLEDGHLVMRAYVGISWFGKTMRLARVAPGEEMPKSAGKRIDGKR